MNLRRHLPAISYIDEKRPALAYRLRRYFQLPAGPLIATLTLSGLYQADLVLALLRFGTPASRTMAESLVGKPITICPGCLLHYNYNRSNPIVTYTQPTVTWVLRDPPLRNSTKIADSYREFRVGRTRQQLIARGVSKGDIRRAIRRGWVKMSEANA